MTQKNQFFAIFYTASYVRIRKQGVRLKNVTETETNNKFMKLPSTFYIANESSSCALANASTILNNGVNLLSNID